MKDPSVVLRELVKVFPTKEMPARLLVSSEASPRAIEGKVAVAGVNLIIHHGERLGIVGRNGAGKSTLLQLIAGLISPTSGSVEVVGKVTSVMTLGVGLREELSGRRNIYLDGEIQGKSRLEIDRVADAIIAFADLGEFIDYPVRTYSTGMKARLGFAMISHLDPEILIIDEALAVGDAAFAAKATARIREICSRGKIVIIVSHSMQSVRELCNRCLWMDEGKIVQDGSPEEVTKAYVEAVRSVDEAALIEKFRKLIGVRHFKTGFEFSDVLVYQGRDPEPRTSLEAGQPTFFRINVRVPPEAEGAEISVCMIRLDDLLLFNEVFPADSFRLNGQSIGLEIEMTPLQLGAAIYRLDVSVRNGSEVCAESSSIFEVYALNPPTGGKPMLFSPIGVDVKPVE
jgi:lipopolysaccharide transport system ATP-binding protein